MHILFLVGRDGEFDQIVSSVIKRAKRSIRDYNSSLIWVLPYPTAEFQNNEKDYDNYYDEIEICESSSMAHPKGAIQIRNKEMIDRSDLVVCYIDHESGGAYQSIKYAIKQGKTVINISACLPTSCSSGVQSPWLRLFSASLRRFNSY